MSLLLRATLGSDVADDSSNCVLVDFSQLGTPDGISGGATSVAHETLMHFAVNASHNGSLEVETNDGRLITLALSETGISNVQAVTLDNYVIMSVAPELDGTFSADVESKIVADVCRLCIIVGQQVQENSVILLVLSTQKLVAVEVEDLQASCRASGLQVYARGEPCDAVVDESDRLFFVHNASESASTTFSADEWDSAGVQLTCTTTKDTVLDVADAKPVPPLANIVVTSALFALGVVVAIIVYVTLDM